MRHNGVFIHRNVEIPNKTGAGSKEGPNALPIRFQDHSNPVRFRNLWIAPLKDVSTTSDSAAQWPTAADSAELRMVDGISRVRETGSGRRSCRFCRLRTL